MARWGTTRIFGKLFLRGRPVQSREKYTITLPSSWTASGDYQRADITVSGLTGLKDDDDWDVVITVSGTAQNKLIKSASLFAHSNWVSGSAIRIYAEAAVDISAVSAYVIVRRT